MILSLFSALAINWNVNPDLITIGSLHIRYYSLFFVIGFWLGYRMFVYFYKREQLPVSLLDPLLFTLIICTIVGARLGHVLFYQPEYYLANPAEIFKIWHGGLASHGGAIAILIGLWWYARHYGKKYSFDFLWILDRIGIVIAFAGMFIRLGNLMNSEIYGDVTDLPWGFVFLRNGEIFPKHPTQLYEALAYLILGIALLLLYKYRLDKLKRGFLFGLFLTGLFGARFLIEFIKEPQVDFETGMALNMGQLLSIPFVIAGIILMIRSSRIATPAMRETANNAKEKGEKRR